MVDGVSRLQEFLRAEENWGYLWNLTDSLGPSYVPPPDLFQPRPPRAYRIRSKKCHTYLCFIPPYRTATPATNLALQYEYIKARIF